MQHRREPSVSPTGGFFVAFSACEYRSVRSALRQEKL